MSYLDDENLLGQLVDETFTGPENPLEMTAYELFYQSSFQCYQLTIGEKTYTFPSNWGPFVEVHKREGEGIVFDNDLDFFNTVFGSLVGIDVKTAFVYKGHQTFMLFIPQEMEVNFDDLHSLVSNDSEFKLAA